MNFQLTKNHAYWWPVTVRIPDPDPANAGKVITQSFKMKFQPLERAEQIEADNAVNALTEAKAIVEHEQAMLIRVCKDWDDVDGPDKNPEPFTKETFLAALQQSWFRTGVYEAYGESLSGEEARLGN